MNSSIEVETSGALQRLYNSDESARAIFDLFGQRQKDTAVSNAGRVAYLAGVSYSETIRIFRELDGIGCGRFIPGRKGYKSRMAWDYSIRSLAAAAKGGTVQRFADILESEIEDDDELFEIDEGVHHQFNLRPDFIVSISLPSDLNQREADRLAAFIQTLPFA